MPTKLRVILGFLVGAALFCFAVVFAKAQQVEMAQGLVCDTAEQIEQFVALHNQRVSNDDALAAINSKAKNACGVVAVAFYRGDVKKSVMADGQVYDIVAIFVVGAHDGVRWIRVVPVPQHTIIPSKNGERDA